MATPTTRLESAEILEQVLGICRELLAELGNERAAASVEGAAHLDRNLGLGSLERVELLVRLDAAFRVRLPDRAVAEADTPNDLAAAVTSALTGAAPAAPRLSGVAEAALAPARLSGPGSGTGVEHAQTLVDVLRHRARLQAGHPHIFLYGEDDAPATITFGQLYERAEALAHELARRGISAGHTVAIMLPTSAEFFYTFFGVLLAGGIPVPIYPPFRADRIEEYAARQAGILRNAAASLLITFRRAEAVARLLLPQVRSLEAVVTAARLLEAAPRAAREAAPGAGPVLLHQAHARDIAFLQYTSGSTGSPKGVILTHANLLANIRAIGEAVAIGPQDVGVTWLPLYHDMGLIGTWLTPLYFGIPVAVHSPLAFLTRPERWLRAIHTHRGTLTAAPNFAFELCVRKVRDADLEGLDLSCVRAMLNGAEPVSPETLDRFAARFAPYGLRREALLPVYGLAESALAVTFPPLGRGPLVDRIDRDTFEREGRAVPAPSPAAPGDRKTISFVALGRALPGHEVRIVDAAGREVPGRVEGALWFRGPSATRGYYRNPEATAQLFPAGPPPALQAEQSGESAWVDSGDRAYTAAGDVYVTGRVKDIIIKAGRNLYPHEVEDLAAGVEGVRRGGVVAFGLRDAANGTERLVVVAETREQHAAAKSRIARGITERVAASLGLPPDVVKLVPPQSIPKTSSGKLRREETRRHYLAGTLGARRQPVWWQLTRLAAASSLGIARRIARRAVEFLYGVYATIVLCALDRAHLAAGAVHTGSGGRRADHFPGAAVLLRAGGLPDSRGRPGESSRRGAGRLRLQPCQQCGRARVDGRAGRALPLRGQARGDVHALHRPVHAQARTPGLRSQRPRGTFATDGGDRGNAAPRRVRVRFSRRHLHAARRPAALPVGRVQGCGQHRPPDLSRGFARPAALPPRRIGSPAARPPFPASPPAHPPRGTRRFLRLARSCAPARRNARGHRTTLWRAGPLTFPRRLAYSGDSAPPGVGAPPLTTLPPRTASQCRSAESCGGMPAASGFRPAGVGVIGWSSRPPKNHRLRRTSPMRKAWCLFGLVLLLAVSAAAQDNPKADVFLGYSYVRANPGSTSGIPGFNLNGGSANVAFNATPTFGVVADFGGYHVGNIGGVPASGAIYSYLFGPRISFRGDRVTPFAQALFGGAHATAGAAGTSATANTFAMALGGGLDVKATEHVAVRLVQAEYLMTRFDVTGTGRTNQNNARISAGIIFRW